MSNAVPASPNLAARSFLNAVTAFYLVLPTLLFAYGWLRWPINLITISLIFLLLVFITKDIHIYVKFLWKARRENLFSREIISWGIVVMLILGAWLSFSGVGGLGFQNDDYRARNALLNDLINQPFPLTATISGVKTEIVYYYNYYLPAVMIGKAWGWSAANSFMILWSFTGISLAFAWFYIISQVSLTGKVYRLLPLVLIFCLAGGLDFLGAYVIKDISFSWSRHIEFWVEYFQYSSNTTLLYWVPQHAIPAWLLSGMVVSRIYKAQRKKYFWGVITASILWSPFAFVGILPFILMFSLIEVIQEKRTIIFDVEIITLYFTALWTGIIYTLYLAANRFSFPITFIWNVIESKRHLIATLLKFWFVEFGLLAFLLVFYMAIRFFASNPSDKKASLSKNWLTFLNKNFQISPMLFAIFLLSLLILVILPFFKMGLFNDIVMRASIPALFILWAFVSKMLLDSNVYSSFHWKSDFIYFLILITLIAGFLTSYSEIARSIENYSFGPPPLDTVVTVGSEDRLALVNQRAGNEDAFFYQYLGK